MLRTTQPVRVIFTGGAGGQALHFLHLCRKRGKQVVVVGIVEGHNRFEAMQRAKRAGPQCQVFDNVAEAIARADFDAGIVCSRPEAHAAEIIALLDAGKDVLAEKPPTQTLAEMMAIADAERKSKGVVVWEFQLEYQWGGLRDRLEDGEHGLPLVIESVWVRGRLSDEEQRRLEAGIRLGQRGRPIVDLCHMVQAAIRALPGARPIRVLGKSWAERVGDEVTAAYETLTASVVVPWQGKKIEVQLRIVCGFNIPLPGEHTTEEVYLAVQGFRGTERVNLLVDERVIGGRPRAPRDYWASRTVLSPRGALEDRYVKSPQPMTVVDCYAARLDDFIAMISSDTRVSGAEEGLVVMQLIDAFARSEALGREVFVTPTDSRSGIPALTTRLITRVRGLRNPHRWPGLRSLSPSGLASLGYG